MVIRGKTRGNGVQLAGYLMTKADNDAISVFEIRGTFQDNNLKSSLTEMSLTSELTLSSKGLYHAQINPAYGEDKKMQPEDWLKAADILEEELNLKDQKRVIVFHEKKGRKHAHIVWERYDHNSGKMISDSFSRLAQDRARKIMETELAQQLTPNRNAKRPEMKLILSELWHKTVTGAEFIKEALQSGYTIAKGELRRPFMVVNDKGRSFDLVRQLKGIKSKEVQCRLKNEPLQNEKDVITKIRNLDSIELVVQKPGHWVNMYEQKAEELLKDERKAKKEKMVREMIQQIEKRRQNFRQMEK